MRKSILAITCALGFASVANVVNASSLVINPTVTQAEVSPSVTLFEYPEPANSYDTGVLFYFTPDLMEYYGDDVTVLTTLIDESINNNNTMFRNSGIGIQRQAAGIYQVADSYVDKETYKESLNYVISPAFLKALGADEVPDSQAFSSAKTLLEPILDEHSASYVTILQRRYEGEDNVTDIINPDDSTGDGLYYDWVGLGMSGSTGGFMSIITPYDNTAHSPLIMSHELGHNDGLAHQGKTSSAYVPGGLAAECGGNYSIMYAGTKDYNDLFFSDQYHADEETGVACGEDDVADSAQYLRYSLLDGSFLAEGEAPNQRGVISPALKGSVSLTLSADEFAETGAVTGEVVWEGLEVGDIANVTVAMSDYMDTSPESYKDFPIVTLQYTGEPVSTFSFALQDNEVVSADAAFTLSAMYGNGVNIQEDASVVSASIISDDLPIVGFADTALTVTEGGTITGELTLENEADTDVSVTLMLGTTTGEGSASDVAFDQTVIFEAGQNTATFTIEALTDTVNESDEMLTITIDTNDVIATAADSVDVTVVNVAPAAVNTGSGSSDSSGGGSMSFWGAGLLALIAFGRRRKMV